jgi:hypothetical protein
MPLNVLRRWSGCAFNVRAHRLRGTVAIFDQQDRRSVAVVVTSDGRRVQMPVEAAEVPVLSLLRSILAGLEELVLLITGRRDDGTRRSDRS